MMLLLLGGLLLAPDDSASKAVAPAKIVKFDELVKALAAHKGKIVVVDFWADSCAECKREFPGLVKLHREHGGADGLVCLSVAIDDPTEEGIMDRINGFLKKQDAAFENFVLNEPQEVWEKKLGIHAVPAVFVFGRDGKLAKAFKCETSKGNPDGKVAYDGMITPFVKEELKK